MSGIRPVFPGHIPDINLRCPEYGQEKLVLFRTSNIDVRNVASLSWPYSGHGCHFLVMFRTSLALFRTSMALFRTSLALFRTPMALFRTSIISLWPYSGHYFAMSGIGPGKTGHIPDINIRCPERGQSFLALFRTSQNNVRNMASFQKSMETDVRNMASNVRNMASDVRNMASDVRNKAKNPGPIPDITN